MKILRRKSDVVLLEIEQTEKQNAKVEFIRDKKWTTLDFIGLAALTMFQHVLFQGLLIDEDNRRGNQDIDKIKKE